MTWQENIERQDLDKFERSKERLREMVAEDAAFSEKNSENPKGGRGISGEKLRLFGEEGTRTANRGGIFRQKDEKP